MTQKNNNNRSVDHKPQPPRERKFIDFRKLSPKELKDLASKWETDAKILEFKIEKYRERPSPNEEKVQRLWGIANSLWRRVVILEKWKRKNITSK